MRSKNKNLKIAVKKARLNRARASSKVKKCSQIKLEENNVESNKKLITGKAMVIAQEMKFARLLASNNKRVRDKVLKNLKKWLTVRSQSSFGEYFSYQIFIQLLMPLRNLFRINRITILWLMFIVET